MLEGSRTVARCSTVLAHYRLDCHELMFIKQVLRKLSKLKQELVGFSLR